MRVCVFDVLDKAVTDTLSSVTLLDLVNEAERHQKDSAQMFYI